MSEEKLQAYCVKCKTKRDMQDPQAVYTKTGAPGTRGVCTECGTNLFRMGETPAHANVPKPEKIEKPVRKKKATKAKKRKKAKKKQPKKNIGKLVIVESPAKARSIGGFLGKGYTVMSSKGHVRDLLKTTLSVDVENEFEPKYRVPNDKRAVVKELKSAAQYADEIFLATDPDREGEAIAWHLVAAAEMPEDNIKRVVFHEITDTAVAEAFSHPREIDIDLVNAQQARRILDRLVGYNITELLWAKVRNRLSAGRVQSIALRIVVEREKEIEAFTPVEYWSIDALLGKKNLNGKKGEFTARLAKINGEDPVLDSEQVVNPHVEILEKSLFIVKSVKRGTRIRRPSAPFTTSTLQQEASRRLNFNARRTMQNAQQLYEGIDIGQGKSVGLITYMRTDSVQVSEQAQADARDFIHENFGEEYAPDKPPKYKTKSKGAQEAHEAVRPTNVERTPREMKEYLKRDQYRMYKLIWERFVASQMSNAVYDTLRVELNAGLNEDDTPYLFRASGSKIRFYGFLALYEDSRDEDSTEDDDEGLIFPELDDSEKLDLRKLMPDQHFTQPPPRYTEASLVRTLEEYGIGRPSTYAPTVTVIQSRDYVNKEDKRLVPTETGRIVSDLLAEYFAEEMNYTFTAKMEDQLDGVSEGKMDWRPMLDEFYTPFEKRLINARENMPKQIQEELVGRTCPTCNTGDLVIKYGRWGKFIGCSNYPECRHTEQHLERTGHVCPTCGEEHGGEVVQRKTRKGRTFYGCNRYPDCDFSQWKLTKDLTKIEDNATDPDTKERSIS
jgi:DNA topoisomerase I